MTVPVEDETADFIAGCVLCGVTPDEAAEVEVITRFMADAAANGQIGVMQGLALTQWAAEWIQMRRENKGGAS